MTVSRTYKSPLREEQMEQTRERLLETVADMLADGSEDITVASVAERAKVSVRTAYRYFQTKEELIDAFNVWMSRKWGSPPLPTTVEELPGMAAKLIESFERNERLVRAARRSGTGAEIRKRRKAEQVKLVQAAVVRYAPHYDEAMVRKITGLFLNLIGSEAWLIMKDAVGMSTPESIEAVHWGFDAIVTKIESERARAKGKKARS
jgi:AcrR family transcriptional regulator